MTVRYETRIKRFTGLDADSKPADSATSEVPIGSYYWAYDTGILYKTYDGTSWVPHSVRDITQASAETQSFHQAAASYDLYTATGGSVFVQAFTLTNTINHVAEAGAFTGISVETTSVTPVVLVAQAAGVHAQLSAGKVFTFSTPFALLVGEKIQYTIYGGETTADPAGFTCTCRYQPIHPSGYLA